MLSIELFKKLNIEVSNIDLDKSYSDFDFDTLNLIIELFLKKDDNFKCESCYSPNVVVRSSKKCSIKTSTLDSKNVLINLGQTQFHLLFCQNKFLH